VKSLAAVDLNLLVALDALIEESNVTRAAGRMRLSQPAMSRALGRLRDLLGDDVLVRSPDGMRLTARAQELAPRLRTLLTEIEETIFDQAPFDPATVERRFSLSTSDYGGFVLLPALVRAVRAEAPRIEFSVRPLPRTVPVQDLADGEMDLVVGTFAEPIEGVTVETLFTERFVCLTAEATDELTLDRYLEMDHVLISSPREGPGSVDHALEALGLARRVAVHVPHFAVAPKVVAGSDLVVTLPERLVRSFGHALDGLQVSEPPLDLPTSPVSMIWHERSERHPTSDWLRAHVRAAARGESS
jgi:DNA-binding transcriptional LysR family regulator